MKSMKQRFPRQRLISLSQELLVKVLPKPVDIKELLKKAITEDLTQEESWQLNTLGSLTSSNQYGSSGKTFQECCQAVEERISKTSSKWFKNSGMGSHGEYWTW